MRKKTPEQIAREWEERDQRDAERAYEEHVHAQVRKQSREVERVAPK